MLEKILKKIVEPAKPTEKVLTFPEKFRKYFKK